MRPGPGWRHLAGPVWEHGSSGARIHTMGLVRMPDLTFAHANRYPESIEAEQMIRINGGNKRRGLMAWAIKLMRDVSSGPVR